MELREFHLVTIAIDISHRIHLLYLTAVAAACTARVGGLW